MQNAERGEYEFPPHAQIAPIDRIEEKADEYYASPKASANAASESARCEKMVGNISGGKSIRGFLMGLIYIVL